MQSKIEVIPDLNVPGSEELSRELKAELAALEIGEIKETTEKARDGTLAIDIVTIGVIISGARLTVDVLRAVISIVKEIRLRFADKKQLDADSAPKITLRLEAGEKGKKPIELKIPASKASETRFIKRIVSKEGEEK